MNEIEFSTVKCNSCQGEFDVESDKLANWKCICKNPTTSANRVFNICSQSTRHRYWSYRAQACPECAKEAEIREIENRASNNSVLQHVVMENGIKIPIPVPYTPLIPGLTKEERQQKELERQEKLREEQVDREKQIISLLQKIDLKLIPSEAKELDDK